MKKIIINFSVLFLGVIAAILLLEGITRIFKLSPLWEGVRHSYYKDNMARFVIQNKTLGWRGKPELDIIFQKWQGEFNTRIETNSKGFRCYEIPYQKTNDKKRILFLGDSFGWGLGVSNSEMFSYILQSQYDDILEVINLSVSGYDLVQEYIMYKTEGIQYNPDTIILLFYIGNDIYRRPKDEDINNIKKPCFILKNDELHFQSREYPLLTKKEYEQWGKRKGFFNKIKFIIQTRCNNSDFIVVIIPDIYHMVTSIEINGIDYGDEEYKPIFWLTKQLESEKIAHINLLEEFTSQKWRDKKLYYTMDRHLNQVGHKALEQILENFLFEHQYIVKSNCGWNTKGNQ